MPSRFLPIAASARQSVDVRLGGASIFPCQRALGVRTIADQPLVELVPYIDWSPFFHTWELRGRYPAIFDEATVGPKAKELYDDAQTTAGGDHP